MSICAQDFEGVLLCFGQALVPGQRFIEIRFDQPYSPASFSAGYCGTSSISAFNETVVFQFAYPQRSFGRADA